MQNNSKILKNETRELHDSAETVFRSAAIMDGSYTSADYVKLLSVSLGYLYSLEKFVEQHWPSYGVLLERKRVAIENDLQELKVRRASNSLKDGVNPNEGAYFYLGMVYVILGSMLGNTVIHKHIKNLPVFETFTFHYLTLHQGEVSEIWKEFVGRIDQLNEVQFKSVLLGARAGYKLLHVIVSETKD